jgi:hypothetical protein
MRLPIALAACVACVLRAAAPPGAPFTIGPLLHDDDFRGGLARWSAEVEKPGTIQATDGVLSIDVPAGCTLWFRPELSGGVLIQYEARMVKTGGPNDRVSDLNAFWMATDARSPADLFATRRSGKFADYDQLRTYYVGQGGNTNSTTRFRRYIGAASDRPLLPEHDLRSPDVLLKPNVWQTVQLVAMGNRIQYYRDGILIFDFNDPAPYTHGRFGFRTTFSHVELRNFSVHRIEPSAAPLVRANETATTIALDNGLVALTFSKQTGTFHRIQRYVDGKLVDLATGPEAYYWDSNSQPDEAPPGVPRPTRATSACSIPIRCA